MVKNELLTNRFLNYVIVYIDYIYFYTFQLLRDHFTLFHHFTLFNQEIISIEHIIVHATYSRYDLFIVLKTKHIALFNHYAKDHTELQIE